MGRRACRSRQSTGATWTTMHVAPRGPVERHWPKRRRRWVAEGRASSIRSPWSRGPSRRPRLPHPGADDCAGARARSATQANFSAPLRRPSASGSRLPSGSCAISSWGGSDGIAAARRSPRGRTAAWSRGGCVLVAGTMARPHWEDTTSPRGGQLLFTTRRHLVRREISSCWRPRRVPLRGGRLLQVRGPRLVHDQDASPCKGDCPSS